MRKNKKGILKVYDAFEKDRQQYAIGLKNKVDKLRKEYETLNKQNIPKPNKILVNRYDLEVEVER